jgi:uncharacterized protein (DUF885 family)
VSPTAGVNAPVQTLFDTVAAADPIAATQLGLTTGLDRLPSYSPAAVAAYLAAVRAQEPALRAFATAADPGVAVDARIGLQIVARVVRDLEMRRVHETDPGLYIDTAYGILLAMIKEIRPAADRVDALRGRLESLPRVFEEGIANLTGPVPRVMVESALEAVPGTRDLVADAVRLFAAGAGRSGDLDAAAQLAGEAVDRFATHLRDRLLPVAGDGCAAGRDTLVAILADEHMLDETPERIAAVGRGMVAETAAAMDEAAAAMGFASAAAAVAAVQEDSPADADALVAGYVDAVNAAHDYVRAHDLVTLPETERLSVEPTPEFMRAALPFAGYEGPGPFETVPRGFYWVTVPRAGLSPEGLRTALSAHPFASMPTVGVHEAYPGHHTQFVRAAGAPTLARRIATLPAGGTLTIEGWAFYCEEMMERQGFLAAPDVRLMRLNDQLWRACRVVIDMEVHLGLMSFGEAVEYLSANAHIGRFEAEQEVRWYVRAPGYPMSYLIGKRELVDLSRLWSARRSTTVKAFHDAVLDWGAAPPALMRHGLGLGPLPDRLPGVAGEVAPGA